MNKDDLKEAIIGLKKELKGHGFLTKSMEDVADLLEGSADENIEFPLDDELLTLFEEELKFEGILIFPTMNVDDEHALVRFYRSGTLVGDFINTIARPGTHSDAELATFITKVRNQWDYSRTQK